MGVWTWLKELVADLTRPCATCGSRFHTETAHCPIHPHELLDDLMGGCWSCEWNRDWQRRLAQARADAAAREAELDRLADKIAERLRGPGA